MMGSLAYLAHTASWQVVEDCTNISTQTQRRFFSAFIDVGSGVWAKRWITLPTKEELEASMRQFARAGLHGCFCVGDGVHIRCWRVPFNLKHSSQGKEGYPTRAYLVYATFDMRIISVSQGFFGSWNDITLAKFDSFSAKMRDNLLFRDVTFVLSKLDGKTERLSCIYALVDNGLPAWRVMMCSRNQSSDPVDVVFSKWVESVRKLIECRFFFPLQMSRSQITQACLG
jgi:hypothetical protein